MKKGRIVGKCTLEGESQSKSIDSIGLLMIKKKSIQKVNWLKILLCSSNIHLSRLTFLHSSCLRQIFHVPNQTNISPDASMLSFFEFTLHYKSIRQRILCAYYTQGLHSVLLRVQRSIRLTQLVPHRLALKCSKIF